MMTNRVFLESVIAMIGGAELSAEVKAEMLEKANHNKEVLDRKGTSERKPSATQVENANLREVIANILVEKGVRMTIAEISAELGEVEVQNPITPNRVSALMSALVKSGTVARIKEGKATYFVAI